MTAFDPQAFAREWITAWNAHDVERVLALFAEEATFTSPLAVQVVPESEGALQGKAAIRHYWTTAMGSHSSLHFTLTGVFAGVNCVSLAYRNERGLDRVESFVLRNGLVVAGYATYPA